MKDAKNTTHEIEIKTVIVKAKLVPAGTSGKTGKSYDSFVALKVEDGKQWVDFHIVNADAEKRADLIADIEHAMNNAGLDEIKIALTLRDLWERPKENGKYRLFYGKNLESWKLL